MNGASVWPGSYYPSILSNLGVLYGNGRSGGGVSAGIGWSGEVMGGSDHTCTLDIVSNPGPGVLYARQGKLAEAEQKFQRALDGKEKAWGQDISLHWEPSAT